MCRFDMRQQLAQWVGAHQKGALRRYEVGQVFRAGGLKAPPVGYPQADFDIISGSHPASKEESALADAEVIKVATEVVSSLPEAAYDVRLSHRALLSACWHHAGVPLDDALRRRGRQRGRFV